MINLMDIIVGVFSHLLNDLSSIMLFLYKCSFMCQEYL